jgi:hypothetical protein
MNPPDVEFPEYRHDAQCIVVGFAPPAVARRIAALKPAQLKRVGLRLLDARRIENLFPR